MANILKKISIFHENKSENHLFDVIVEAGKGLPGDRSYNDEANQISILLDIKGQDKVDGLCTKRFKANLTIESNTQTMLEAGDIIHINDVELLLTKGKKCHEDCLLHKNAQKCHLKENAFFASPVKGGHIIIGNNATIRK